MKKAAVKTITHEDYKRCILEGKNNRMKMNTIRSRYHVIFTETVSKVALSCEVDKRMIERIGRESFVTSLFTFCFISIHFQVEKEER